MKYALTIFNFLLFISYCNNIDCQKVKVEGGPLVLPKYTSSERDGLIPEIGMIIYNKDLDKFQGYTKFNELYNAEESSDQCLSSSDRDLSFNYVKIEPPFDMKVTAIDLGSSGVSNGTIEVIEGNPCGNWNQIGSSVGLPEYPDLFYVRFKLSSSIELNSGGVYYVRTLSGTVAASFGCIISDELKRVCRRVTYTDLGPYCTIQTEIPYCKLIGENWVNLNE